MREVRWESAVLLVCAAAVPEYLAKRESIARKVLAELGAFR